MDASAPSGTTDDLKPKSGGGVIATLTTVGAAIVAIGA